MTPASPSRAAPPPSGGGAEGSLRLAIASVIFGFLAVVLSVFVIGALPAMVGLGLGLAHLRRGRPAPLLARWGMGICLIALLSSVGFAFAWRSGMKHRQESMQRFLADLPAWRGVTAPNASFRTLEDKTLHLADLRGRPVVVTFWNTAVPPCLDEVPRLIRLRREVPERELGIVAVSIERPKPLQRFVEKKGVNYPICWLGRMDVPPPPFDNILAVPVTFFLDRNGVIQDVVTGPLDYETLKAKALAPPWSQPTNAPPPVKLN